MRAADVKSMCEGSHESSVREQQVRARGQAASKHPVRAAREDQVKVAHKEASMTSSMLDRCI